MIRKIIILLALAILLVAPASAWTYSNGCWTQSVGSDTVVMFNATGNFSYSIPTGVSSIWYTVVGGGGSGGVYAGGGGGAGAVKNGTLSVTGGTTYSGSVGAGAIGVSTTGNGNKGSSSSFSSISAEGGGYGGGGNTGGNGGSGGGGAAESSAPYTGLAGGSATDGGKNGGSGITGATAGGGGGGQDHDGYGANTGVGGDGGNATAINITGTNTFFGAGGGGAGSGTGGLGGSFNVGGHGSNNAGSGVTNGTPGTGSGGGGLYAATGGIYSGAGGSGVVIIRYSVITPVADFTITNTTGTEPLLTHFTDTSTGSPTSWNYTAYVLGNSTEIILGSTQNLDYTFSQGNFSPMLNVTNAVGYNKTALYSKWVNVSALPMIPDFVANVTSGYSGTCIAFTDLTTGSPSGWNWSFGDGNLSTSQNPEHCYSVVGNFSVALNVSRVV